MPPPAAERTEQVDLGGRHLAIHFGHLRLAFRKCPLGIEQRQRVHLPFALLGADDFGGNLGLVPSGLQRFQALERIGVGGQRGLGLLQRAQDGAVEVGQRFLRSRFGSGDSRAGARVVRE